MRLDRVLVDRQFAEQICQRLPDVTIQSRLPFKANFRCHICGDSQKNKRKKRGYIIENDGGIGYYCHNCNANPPFHKYIAQYWPDLLTQYQFAQLSSRTNKRTPKQVEPEPIAPADQDYLKSLTPLIKLPRSHDAVQYVLSRKLPHDKLPLIYYTDKFYKYINSFVTNKFSYTVEKDHDHGRIILPLIDQQQRVFGVIGRAVHDHPTRYFTIKFDPNAPKFFGLDRLDYRKHAYVLEGAFDSFFFNNSIAFAGTDGKLDQIFANKNSHTVVLDNQPRNAEVISQYSKYVSNGHTIVIWPAQITSKDINQMVLDGMTPSQIHSIVASNSWSGLQAEIQLNRWKKV